jgi:hypothetical protein
MTGGRVAVAVTGGVGGRVVGVAVGVGVPPWGAAHPARITHARASTTSERIFEYIPPDRGCRYMAFVETGGKGWDFPQGCPGDPRPGTRDLPGRYRNDFETGKERIFA